MIWEAAKSEEGREFLRERGLSIRGTLFRQVGLGDYGIADLIAVSLSEPLEYKTKAGKYRLCIVDLYELKCHKIGLDTLGQILRYREGIEYFINELFYFKKPIEIVYTVNMIGYEIIQAGDFLSIARSIYEDINLYQYRMDFKGIHFSCSQPYQYQKVKPGLPSTKLFSKGATKAIVRKSLTYGPSKPA